MSLTHVSFVPIKVARGCSRLQQISIKRDLIGLGKHKTSHIKISKSMIKIGDVNALPSVY